MFTAPKSQGGLGVWSDGISSPVPQTPPERVSYTMALIPDTVTLPSGVTVSGSWSDGSKTTFYITSPSGGVWRKSRGVVEVSYGTKTSPGIVTVPDTKYGVGQYLAAPTSPLGPGTGAKAPTAATGPSVSATVPGPGGVQPIGGTQPLGEKAQKLLTANPGLLAASVSIGVALHPLAGLALFWLGSKGQEG